MGNHFYGTYHWDFCPVKDRVALLDALEVFCDGDTNLFIESISPSILKRFTFWRMRSRYQTHLIPDTLSPRPAVFHIALSPGNLSTLKAVVKQDGLDESSIAHIKGYSGDQGLFWFHGFCDESDQTLSCSQHVSEALIEKLESKLGLKAEKKFGELKSDQERRKELERIIDAMERYQQAEQNGAASAEKPRG